jgi:G3E family GTPase
MSSKIPVTLLVGFLGSGKTTLINNILKCDHQLKIAIIENEFGSLNIDQEFINKEQDIENYLIEMNNGCLCCTMNGDLVITLAKLLDRRQDFDHIVIEATGVANPGPIIEVFSSRLDIKDQFELSSVVTVVDSNDFFENLQNTKEDSEFSFEEQLIFSDYILLNKIDLIDPDLLDFHIGQIESFIKKINFDAEMVQTNFCNVVISDLLKRKTQNIHELNSLKVGPHHQHGKGKIGQISIEIKGDFDPEKLQLFINTLYMQYRKRLFRVKAVLSFPTNKNRILLQGVNEQIAFEEGQLKDKNHANKFVFIGIDLKSDIITKSLKNCLVSS